MFSSLHHQATASQLYTDLQLAFIEIDKLRSKLRDQVSLRDQFAMAALSGLLGHPKNTCDPEHDSETAYQFADEMMKRRKIKPEQKPGDNVDISHDR